VIDYTSTKVSIVARLQQLSQKSLVSYNAMNTEESRSKIRTICLMVMTAATGVYFVYWLRPVLLPLVVAIMIVSGASPLLEQLQKRLGVSKMLAAGITFVAGMVVLTLVGTALWASTNELASHSGDYEQRFEEMLETVESNIPLIFWEGEPAKSGPSGGAKSASQPDATAASDDGGAPEKEATEKEATEKAPVPPESESAGAKARVSINSFLNNMVRDGVTTVSSTLLQLISTSVIVLIYVFFLLLGSPGASEKAAWRDIDRQIRTYLAQKTVISLLTGITFGGALWIAGVPMAVTFGVLAFLLNFIPNVGPVIAGLLPVPFVLLDPSGSIWWMTSVIVVSVGIQTISGNVVEPKVMGKSSDLHPVVVLVALMFWGMLWGITGMFLATPITAAIKIVLERFESTRPVAAMLAGRWQIKQLSDTENQPPVGDAAAE